MAAVRCEKIRVPNMDALHQQCPNGHVRGICMENPNNNDIDDILKSIDYTIESEFNEGILKHMVTVYYCIESDGHFSTCYAKW
jgi:hypothetical protein